MKCLLRIKPDIANIKNNEGQTAYDIALEKDYQLCAELVRLIQSLPPLLIPALISSNPRPQFF
jgi:ankyrin repeat protein